MNMFLLYIDPGTGSILFSILIGLITTLYFVLNSFFIKLKVLVYKTKIDVIDKYPIVIYSEGKQYWNVFFPICESFERRKIGVNFFTSSSDDPVFEQSYKYVKAEYIGSGNKAYARLNILDAGVCLMTTPGLDVYQLKRSKRVKHYSHILHALGDATTYRLFGLDYFDSVLLSGNYQKDGIRELEHLRNIKKKDLCVVGCPYMDVLSEKIKEVNIDKKKFTLLLAPSWGANGILAKYGVQLIDPLLQTGWDIIIRPHPQSLKSEQDILLELKKRYIDADNIIWDYNIDNIKSLYQADILISDFSSVIFDYCFLFDKPFLYCNNEFDHRPYDSSDLSDLPWKFKVLKEIGVELTKKDFINIKEVVSHVLNDVILKDNRKKAKDTAWQNRGMSGEAVCDYLMSVFHNQKMDVEMPSL